MKIKKILILGSGGLMIGQAGEFDYSGSQAIKAIKEEGIQTVLINPNIATIQTSEQLADKVYFLPVTAYFVEKVIAKEKPDGILLSFGGQTALNCGVELHKKGVFEKYNVAVLGTPVKAIIDTEDRGLFVERLNEINAKTPRSIAVNSLGDAAIAAEKIGYPVMIRIAYALGGKGSGIARDKNELVGMARKAFTSTNQILVEEWLGGWKEVEYEVVRDKYDNCITVCNMENFDPLGIHTGESIVVAPSQTLNNSEYHKLREISIMVIRHLGIVGECNIQFALDTESEDYRIIEVNARLSRSSALASKATGYPLAFIAAKLALDYSLIDLENKITRKTMACFEPALDYCVVKIPRWDLQKFGMVTHLIGSEMKSVGEVMAIGKTFEEAMQKALRMLGTGMHGLVCNNLEFDDLRKEISNPTDKRVFAVAEAIKKGISIDEIYGLSKIDKWFLYRMKNITDTEKEISRYNQMNLPRGVLKKAKQMGFSDFQIAKLVANDKKNMEKNMLEIRKLRKKCGIMPVVKQIDTLAAEYPAQTNYLYLTYNGEEDDIEFKDKKKVIVLGSGAYRIGSSVEFDWCCVNAVYALNKLGYKTIMINYNPETVSTDYDVCDKLYFDELTFERVLDIYEKEKPLGVIISMGGQIPNNLAMRLHNANVRVLGTSPLNIDNAEDRHKFSAMLDKLGIDQPQWEELTSINDAEKFANEAGYPVLIRPSYVLSGAAMNVAFDKKHLNEYLLRAAQVSKEHPVVISKFINGAKEIEIDAVADKGDLAVWAISEHIENAGVHSGDATIVLPPQRLYLETTRRIKQITREVARELNITGPFNIQFIAKNNDVKVIECNLRASRSFPFASKVFKVNFIDIATKAIMGKKLPKVGKSAFELDYVGVKAAQFSFSRLKGADPMLSVEMASTGEVACFGSDLNEAFIKSLLSVGFKLPRKNILLSTGPVTSKAELLPFIKMLKDRGYNLFATSGTHVFLKRYGVDSIMLRWPLERKSPNVLEFITRGMIDLVINIPKNYEKEELTNDYLIRRCAVDYSLPLITNLQVAKLFADSLIKKKMSDLEIKSWDEY